MVKPVLVDVDTGVDDALALLFLARHPGVDLLGATCVAGNTDVDRVARNTLGVLDLVGAGAVPVARGAERPLIEPRRPASGFHGEDGLAGLAIPASPRTVSDLPAVELLRRTVAESAAPVTLLALGPLTNVAMFIRLYPREASMLERIVFMGGSASVGNASAVAEFNVWHDPEAAAIVLGAPVPVTMYGLDVFYVASIPAAEIAGLRGSEDGALRFAGDLLDHCASFGSDDPRLAAGGIIGDAGAACSIVGPELVGTVSHPASVELTGSSRGQTIIDRRSAPGEQELHGGDRQDRCIDVAMTVDATAMVDLFLGTIRGGKAV